jgi:hypothetical protein
MTFCARNKVRTPRVYLDAAAATTNVVIKLARPGNSGIVRGPFAPGSVPPEYLTASADVICQDFVPGRMLEAWYWDDQLFAVDTRRRPFVVGDGVTCLRELIACNCPRADWIDWTAAEDALRFQSQTFDTVLPLGKEVEVDIRFASMLQRPFPPVNVLKTIVGTPVHEQLLRAGSVFRNAIPEDVRPRSPFVLGAIIDSQQKLWFTDMVTDVQIHPDAYDPMLRGLFGFPARAQPSPAVSHLDRSAASPGILTTNPVRTPQRQ